MARPPNHADKDDLRTMARRQKRSHLRLLLLFTLMMLVGFALPRVIYINYQG